MKMKMKIPIDFSFLLKMRALIQMTMTAIVQYEMTFALENSVLQVVH